MGKILVCSVVFSILVLLVSLYGRRLARPWREARWRKRFASAVQAFHQARERLELDFFQQAAFSGKPRGLAWTKCDFGDRAVWAREKATGELIALVPVTISFEAVPGGGMEEVEAVHNLRAATAVFHHRQDTWGSQGRVLFNLSPEAAIEHFGERYEWVEDFPEENKETG